MFPITCQRRLLCQWKGRIKWPSNYNLDPLIRPSIPFHYHHHYRCKYSSTKFSNKDLTRFHNSRRNPKFKVFNYYDKSEELLQNQYLRHSLLEVLQKQTITSQDTSYMFNLFCNLLDMISSNSDIRALYLVSDIWEEVLFKSSSNEQFKNLQKMLLSKREIFVHILINQKYYDPYKSLMMPLFEKFGHDIHPQWCDKLATTFQFSETTNGEVSFNDSKIIHFIQNPNNSIHEKRILLANFVRKGVSNSGRSRKIIWTQFFKYLELFDDRHCLLDKPEHSPYTSALFLIFEEHYGKNLLISTIEEIFSDLFLNKKYFYNFLTTMISIYKERSATQSLKIWDFKLKRHARENNEDVLNHKDLTYTMTALFNLRQFNKVIELSKAHPNLYYEDQLVILLRVSESNNDWSMLQSQFEAMYGKGHLPYAIHYSIVMNALANLGAIKDVDRLFTQLLKRNISPTLSIYGSLIKARIKLNQFDEAKNIFNQYLSDASVSVNNTNNDDDDLTRAQVYKLIFEIYLKSPRKDELLEFLQQTITTQQSKNITLLDSYTMTRIINYMEENYGFKEVMQLKQICQDFNLLNEEVYCSLIQAFIRFDQYEMAESLIYEAHHISLLPLKNSKILKEQLRNYRIWYQNCDSNSQKAYIDMKRNFLLTRIQNNEITPKGIQNLYSEVIKFYLARNQKALASSYLQTLTHNGTVGVIEDLYAPFLKYYSKSQQLKDHEKVLALYKEMVGLNVKISIKTYDSIMRSVIFFDKHNDSGYGSCDKLLESIFDMNGLRVPSASASASASAPPSASTSEDPNLNKPSPLNTNIDIDANAIYLCHIVSTYIINKPGTQSEKANFVVDFLTQLRAKLNHQMGILLRLTIYQEMGRLYGNLNNLHMAGSLISSGVNEMTTFIENYIKDYPLPYDYTFEIPIPNSLQNNYLSLIHLNSQVLKFTNAEPKEYLKLFQMTQAINVKLNGKDYNFLISQLMKLENFKGLDLILYIIEEHLSKGSFNELGLMRSLQFLYKLFLMEKSRTMPQYSLEQNYKWFNEFYDVKDISLLKQQFPPNFDSKSKMIETLQSIRKRFPHVGNWDIEYVLNRPEIFFSPEKRLSTVNKLLPHLNDDLYYYLLDYCHGDHTRLFEFMDSYPNAIELILINQSNKLRLKVFRSHISKIIEPPTDMNESFEMRRIRTLKALHKVFRPLRQSN